MQGLADFLSVQGTKKKQFFISDLAETDFDVSQLALLLPPSTFFLWPKAKIIMLYTKQR